jgi:hypothetical protein
MLAQGSRRTSVSQFRDASGACATAAPVRAKIGNQKYGLWNDSVLAMAVAPGPIVALFLTVTLTKFAVSAMCFNFPAVVEDDLIPVPNVIIAVIRIVGTICMRGTSGDCERRNKYRRQ